MKYGIELGRVSTEAFAKEERPPFFRFMKYGIELGRVSTEAFAKEERPPFFCFMRCYKYLKGWT